MVEADLDGADLDEVVHDEDEVAVAAVTIAELLVGVLLADEAHRPGRRRFVDDVKNLVLPVIDYDATVAASHAELLVAARRQGPPRGAHDLIIAATAHATQREVVSADASAYQGCLGSASAPTDADRALVSASQIDPIWRGKKYFYFKGNPTRTTVPGATVEHSA